MIELERLATKSVMLNHHLGMPGLRGANFDVSNASSTDLSDGGKTVLAGAKFASLCLGEYLRFRRSEAVSSSAPSGRTLNTRK